MAEKRHKKVGGWIRATFIDIDKPNTSKSQIYINQKSFYVSKNKLRILETSRYLISPNTSFISSYNFYNYSLSKLLSSYF